MFVILYPKKLDRFKIGDEVYYRLNTSFNQIKKSTFKDVLYNKFTLNIKAGKNLDDYEKSLFPGMISETDKIYAYKYWEESYLLEDGAIIDHYTNLFTLI